jgi:hypothetical protein
VSGDFRNRKTLLRLWAVNEGLPLVFARRVAQSRPRLKECRGERQMRGLVLERRHRMTGHRIKTRGVFGNPFLEPVRVKLLHVLADLGEPQAALVLVGGMSRHFRRQRGGGGDLQIGQRRALRIEIA